MIVYKITDGFAHDLRYEDSAYALKVGEVKHSDGFGALPELESLHDTLAVQTRLDQQMIERLRSEALRAIDDKRLEAAIFDPNAPQAVKDYAARRGSR